MKAETLRTLVQSGKRPLVKLSDNLWEESWGEKDMIAEVVAVTRNLAEEDSFEFSFDYNRFKDSNLPLQGHDWYGREGFVGTAFQAGVMAADDVKETVIYQDSDEIPIESAEQGLVGEYASSGSPTPYVQWLEAKLEALVPFCLKSWKASA